MLTTLESGIEVAPRINVATGKFENVYSQSNVLWETMTDSSQ